MAQSSGSSSEKREEMNHLVMYSGGVGSFHAALRVKERMAEGDTLHLLFSDTKIEDPDLYRFLLEGAHYLGVQLTVLQDGRTPWQVFRDVKFIGNSRIDPCSRILKRDIIRKYIEETFQPETSVVHLGIDWTERHRLDKAQPHRVPWRVEAPMTEEPYLDKEQMLTQMESLGIKRPRLYDMGFPHNNCGGFCVKAGHAHFKLLLQKLPEVYQQHVLEEELTREVLGKDVTVLRCRRNTSRALNDGKPMPLSLTDFKQRTLEEDENYDWGGCGCFNDV